jgi:DNA-binding transcriptional LysR family regulator
VLGERLDGLVRIDLGALPPNRPVWLVMRPDLSRQPRFRAVAEAIVALFRGV